MTARPMISPEKILETALSLVREGGWKAVTARSLALRLGASTMPIYSAVGSMEELKELVVGKALAMMEESRHRPRTGNPLLDLAVGYVAFARDEPALFRLIGEMAAAAGDQSRKVAEAALDPGLEEGSPARPMMADVLGSFRAPEQKSDFVLRSWIFAYGLAELVSEGQVDMDEAEITRHLSEAGGAFYQWESQKGAAP